MVHVSRAVWGWFTLVLFRVIGSTMSIDPCPSTAQSFNVTTTEEATNLATALNCSGSGTFDVLWVGTVIVEETIAITGGSVVTITGVGSAAVADGNGTTRLFSVRNATLALADLGLENGFGDDGDVDLTGRDGGAIWIGGVDSVVSCSGTTTFYNNVGGDGGAVRVQDGAVASWTGQTNFTRNFATAVGAALYVEDGVVNFTGETTFADNSASFISGALYAQSSEVSWSGVMSFDNNGLRVERESGGTIEVRNSNISWQGETWFNGGYGGSGGAIRAFGSTVSWEGKTTFCDNVADFNGGALSIEDSSSVFWMGETLFCNNRVINDGRFGGGLGGALYVTNSDVSWNGATIYMNNSAYTGGAVYADGVVNMVWEGTSNFTDNTANTNAGAVVLGTDARLDLGTFGRNLSLTGNVADVAGGAVYQSGTNYGVTWNGATFGSNSALNGGAVYTVASGTATEVTDEFPTVYIDCTFRDNTAVASGGAIESAAGKDNVINTTFEGNKAGGLGGGLRLAGTASLTGCDFVGNGANEAGPAVANIGTVVVVDSHFTNNNLLCTPGEFLNYTIEGEGTAERAEIDYYNSVCEGCGECARGCLVEGNGTQQCIPALDNTNSTGADGSGVPITLETLTILPGYWRSVATSATILPCWNEDACLGGVTDNANFCESGYRGPYCAICEDEYTITLAYTCSKCSNGEGIAFAVVTLLVALAAVVAVFWHLVSITHDKQDTHFKRLTHALPMQGLKTVLVAWQILTQFDSVANVTYAGVYGQFLDGISSIISFDLGLVLSAGCMAKTDFHDRLIISTLGPLVALCALGVSFQVATRRRGNRGSEEALQAVRRKHFSMALLVTFLVYSSVSSTVFRTFACETLDGGKEYLRADYAIECTTAKHKALQVYAGFMIMMYPVGIPLTYAIILFKHRDDLKDMHHRSVQQSAVLKATADLWKPYRPSRYYYEVVECARRVMLTGVVVFIYPNTAAQVAVTLVLVFVFVMVSEALSAYASKQDSWLSRVAHIVVYLSMFQALVVKVDVSDERSDSQEVFGGVLLAANICMMAAVLVEATMVVYSVCGRGGAALGESVAPGVRNATSVVERWDMMDDDSGPTDQDATS